MVAAHSGAVAVRDRGGRVELSISRAVTCCPPPCCQTWGAGGAPMGAGGLRPQGREVTAHASVGASTWRCGCAPD
eukprot:423741-Pelagomonas_calceolata.AAC.2